MGKDDDGLRRVEDAVECGGVESDGLGARGVVGLELAWAFEGRVGGAVGDWDWAFEDALELFAGDEAGAEDSRFADEGDDGGFDAAAADAAVEDHERGEGFANVSGGGGGDAAGGVGAGADEW